MDTQINYLFKSDRYDDNSQTSIGDMDFGSTQLDGSNDFNDDQVITLTQNSVLVRKCEHSLRTAKFLKYNDINWDKIIYLDINPEPYFTGMAQKVLDNLIFNSQDFLIIHHYTPPPSTVEAAGAALFSPPSPQAISSSRPPLACRCKKWRETAGRCSPCEHVWDLTHIPTHSSHLVEHVALFVACWYSRTQFS